MLCSSALEPQEATAVTAVAVAAGVSSAARDAAPWPGARALATVGGAGLSAWWGGRRSLPKFRAKFRTSSCRNGQSLHSAAPRSAALGLR